MLISLLLVPLMGSLLLLVMPVNNPQNEEKMKVIALSTSLINLFISILLWIQFDSSVSDYQFTLEFNELSFCHFNIGIDGISLYYVLLQLLLQLIVFYFIIKIVYFFNLDNLTSNTENSSKIQFSYHIIYFLLFIFWTISPVTQ